METFFYYCFFFFKRKTAYEIYDGLVGSEMCIRDSIYLHPFDQALVARNLLMLRYADNFVICCRRKSDCLLYTSDAADERSSVDLGGRRIIKKKKQHRTARGHILKDKKRDKQVPHQQSD